MVRAIDELKPHPANETIYGDKPNKELIDSVKRNGILNPLLITWNNRIISGHRRYVAAEKVGLKEVPVVKFGSRDENDILEALIESNRQRKKTKAMVSREAAELAEIERQRAQAREEATQFKASAESLIDIAETPAEKAIAAMMLLAARTEEPSLFILGQEQEQEKEEPIEPALLPVVKPVHTHVEVAEKLGISPATAQSAIAVGQELKKLEASADPEDRMKADEILTAVNERGFKPAAALIQKPSISGRGRPLQMVETLPSAKLATFNQTNNKVDWARWTWNPVTGCLHDCPYCYARDIAERWYPQGFVPTFHADRLSAPRNTRVPKDNEPRSRRVFTCSMADLFGNWVPQEWIDAVFGEIRDNPQWEFLCLTKFPQRLAEMEWPHNAWVGTTVDYQYRVPIAEKAFRGVKAGVKWLSCEPLMEPLKFSSLEMFDWVVIGGASRSTQTPEFWPPVEWIIDLHNQAREAGCAVYWKDNAISSQTKVPKEQPIGRERRIAEPAA